MKFTKCSFLIPIASVLKIVELNLTTFSKLYVVHRYLGEGSGSAKKRGGGGAAAVAISSRSAFELCFEVQIELDDFFLCCGLFTDRVGRPVSALISAACGQFRSHLLKLKVLIKFSVKTLPLHELYYD